LHRPVETAPVFGKFERPVRAEAKLPARSISFTRAYLINDY
jgi:hypothetical protein